MVMRMMLSSPQPIRILFPKAMALEAPPPPQIRTQKQHHYNYSSESNNQEQQLLIPCLKSKNIKWSSRRRRSICLPLILLAAAFPTTTTTTYLLSSSTVDIAAASAAEEEDHNQQQQQQQQSVLLLERYTDINEGFTLLKPSSWIKVEKAGATVLFEDANKGSNNVGVVVTPVRLSSLTEFGTPQFVADKLIQAEKRKESTKDAQVIGVAERMGHGGLEVYEFEYTLDSTRGGMKRIFSAAFVASKKLYLLNIAYFDQPENPLDTSTRMMLEQVLHSFETAK